MSVSFRRFVQSLAFVLCLVLSAGSVRAQSFVSDDFSGGLNGTLWTVVDPVGDATVSTNGTQLIIDLPAGTSHDAWIGGNESVRVLQDVADADFEVELKFESQLTAKFQLHGLLVEEASTGRFIRFDIYYKRNSRAFAAVVDGASADVKYNSGLSTGPTQWFRVNRTGDVWTFSHSADGTNWDQITQFTEAFNVARVGPFAGNAGSAGSEPAYTAIVDYAFNTDSPIIPEDGGGGDTTPPVISNVAVVPTATGATVSWTTDEPATSRVDYGLDATYGSFEEDLTLSTAHSVTLSGLTAATTYHFQITSDDASANSSATADDTFTTDAADTTPPVISGVVVTPTETGATVAWTTDEPATSRVDYGLDATYGSFEEDLTLSTAHSLTLSGLASATTYHFQITSDDASANSSSTSDDTFTTDAADTTPPVISGVAVTPTATGATISWTTDEPADSRVDYGETSSYGQNESESPYVTSHSIVLSGLIPETIYHYLITSKDAAGNTATTLDATFETDAAAQVLDIWHGLTQRVGHLGDAQDDFNILGTVIGNVDSLFYSLNGAAEVELTMGWRPDGFGDWRRLATTGDFNADIPVTSLSSGINLVDLRAVLDTGENVTTTVTVDKQSGSSTLPLTVDWTTTTDPQDLGQYVDGKWGIDGGDKLRILRTGYDRIFLFGERNWQDYEVMVPVTINGIDSTTGPRSGAPGLGFVMRFTGHIIGGHRNWPAAQPKWGYHPMGGITWLRFNNGTTTMPHAEFFKGDFDQGPSFGQIPVAIGGTYWMKAKAVTLPDGPLGESVTTYSFKVWEDGTSEPSAWAYEFTQTSEYALRTGGFGLLAHHIDASFGQVTAVQIGAPDTTPPVIADVSVVPTSTGATVSWTTNEPATSRVNYGTDATYGMFAENPGFTTTHSVAITGLSSLTTYHFEIESSDSSNNTSTTADDTFDTTAPGGVVVSDDFSGGPLNTGLWTVTDVKGDGTVTTNGTQLLISVPAGSRHDAWTGGNESVRVLQAVANTDFEIDVKFESFQDQNIQMNGLLVEEAPGKHLRFDLYHQNNVHAFAGYLDVASSDIKYNAPLAVAPGPEQWIRVKRQGDVWTFSYSMDGTTFTQLVQFTQAIVVNNVGPHVGNVDNNPAYTAVVDYFFDTGSPIVPEDGGGSSPPVISNIAVAPSATGATVTWTTDKPATSRVDYGLDATYGSFEEDLVYKTAHQVELTSLTSDTEYHYQLTSTDSGANTTMSNDSTFTTLTVGASVVVSDDFSGAGLNTSLWTINDPVGDGTVTTNGTQLLMSVPAGTEHDAWESGNETLRVLQGVADDDFEVEVKFESLPDSKYQIQGILIQETVDRYLRFDLYYSKSVRAFAALLDAGIADIKYNKKIASGPVNWLRVGRVGDLWTFSHSTDGSSWDQLAQFTQAIVVDSVGPFVGNAGPSPAFTGVVDYFFDTSAPIVPEDGGQSASVAAVVDAQTTSGVIEDGPSVQAEPVDGAVVVRWEGSDLDTRYELQVEVAGMYTTVAAPVDAHVAIEGQEPYITVSYVHTLEGLEPGKHRLRLRSVSANGAVSVGQSIEVAVEIVGTHLLSENYPNPFSGVTTFELSVQRPQRVKFDVYNILGQRVVTLVDDEISENKRHSVTLDASALPSGTYFVRVVGEDFSESRQIVLIR